MQIMKEIWKDIEGYEGLYQVSNLGRVRSIDRYVDQMSRWGTSYPRLFKGRVLSLQKISGGYVGVLMKENGHTIMKLVHRLVANAFITNPRGLEQVNHKDEDKTNNRADNLEWCDRLYNIRYGTGMLRKRQECTAVRQIDKCGNLIEEFPSIVVASKKTGVCKSTISKCIRHVHGNVTAGGFRWESVNQIKRRKK